MASIVIHLCVAKKINDELKHNEKELFLGSIAPDISKCLGDNKVISHFQKEDDNIPILDDFLKKYHSKLNDDFILGYYIHLYTDYLWFKYFMTEINYKGLIRLLDGTQIDYDEKEFTRLLYNDYTNLNIRLLDEYNLDLSLFYEPLKMPKTKIDEIPVDKLQILLDKASIIIENTKESKDYIFDIENVKQFIKSSSEIISSDVLKLLEKNK